MDVVVGADDDARVFARARRLGVAGVEVNLRRSDLRARTRLDTLRSARERTALSIPSLVLGEHNDGGIASADSDVAAAAARDVRDAVTWAGVLGADVVLVPFFLRGELRSPADIARAAAAFRELCPTAAEGGVTLCYEGTLRADDVLGLADEVASPAFACYFDLGNPIVEGLDPPTELRALAAIVRRVHVKDSAERRGDRRLGEGRVDFDRCTRALDEIGYDGWLVLETPPGPVEAVAFDVSFVRRVFPRLER